MPHLILTAVGPDRPGLVGQLAGHISAAGGNILETRMTNLRGRFAILLLLDAPEESLASLRQSLPAAAHAAGLHLDLHSPASPTPPLPGLPFTLKTYSLDQPGLVHTVTDVLRKHHVNIEELAAKQESAPFAGTPLFTMELRLTIPPTVAVRTLRAELQAAADRLNCDLDLEPA